MVEELEGKREILFCNSTSLLLIRHANEGSLKKNRSEKDLSSIVFYKYIHKLYTILFKNSLTYGLTLKLD